MGGRQEQFFDFKIKQIPKTFICIQYNIPTIKKTTLQCGRSGPYGILGFWTFWDILVPDLLGYLGPNLMGYLGPDLMGYLGPDPTFQDVRFRNLEH